MKRFCKSVVATYLLTAGAVLAQEADMDALLAELADPDTGNWEQVERKIRLEWSKSGSPAMDLLLMRGRDAIEDGDLDLALDHFTALTDHAPDFAEGWTSRASVYFQKELYGPALHDLGRALTLNPNHFEALSGLAVILEETGNREDALEAWRMVADLHPHRPETQAAIERLEKEFGGSSL
ncbi:tetratricopeptide repeat protein [Psychromarinibacter sp. C21-152]|uniref:Tetratricopeptide repeat protein n=1 Tax=Psychromarinibacter sediminicola TaxID=3033385 RepID=A0AAE3NQ39_9RHOB|nr:tetratricopeptide repeat protein [Psychromarinibacter sediminicola]MDF0600379.1 tetratricopeptide repeat protein [Psychromarinibacter sediminicola]